MSPYYVLHSRGATPAVCVLFSVTGFVIVHALNDPVENADEGHGTFMRQALSLAAHAASMGEVPVGAVVVDEDGTVLAQAHNRRETDADPTAHAELLALREASAAVGEWRLHNATLYVTKEPCPMCAGAMVNSRLGRVVFGCSDDKGGAVVSLYHLLGDPRLNHRVEVVSGVMEVECRELLRSFFRARRTGGPKVGD